MNDLLIHSVKPEPIDGVKVSDVFRCINDVKFSLSMSDKKCLVAARAVSNYDTNQDLIASQAETIAKQQNQIELMTKTLTSTRDRLDMLDQDAMGTARMHGVAPWPIRDEVINNITQALATNDKEEV